MSNQSHRLSRNFIKQVVQFYNNLPTTVEPTSIEQRKKLHSCKICSHNFYADLEKTTCPKCDEKRKKIIYDTRDTKE